MSKFCLNPSANYDRKTISDRLIFFRTARYAAYLFHKKTSGS
ncbi:hypothetical protein LSS_22225 [Leptospira santarosai serovar Shermani str. LT 821]|uniref:Uncharacterized protein n=1 Tax=Leptospira santarosai serovar Shermani str. LT 821 TaxID=758847 RepID=A0A097ESQ7_9LEPT|nr:hypothetical protein LSS_22225 [Leptospira santarosai serovar Shermani str. LT 821]